MELELQLQTRHSQTADVARGLQFAGTVGLYDDNVKRREYALRREFMKIGRVVPEIYSRTNTETEEQTHAVIAILCHPTGVR